MVSIRPLVFWFIVGSQHLYGEGAIEQVREHARQMVAGLSAEGNLPYELKLKDVVTTADEISNICLRANTDAQCGGVIAWMHTFSPAKMWIAGLARLQKPLLHLNTQFNRDIPWESIDMDFMNLNQSAHGDREFGFIATRMAVPRKVIVGHWQDPSVQERLCRWMNVAAAVTEGQHVKIARFGDNMRNVAVTEGDKVAAQIQLGWTVDGFGLGDLAERVADVSEADVNRLVDRYRESYEFSEGNDLAHAMQAAQGQARIELGLREFLSAGGYNALTTTFEDLHGLPQLPGLAIQRLMAEGYGFGAEGDWKTAGLLRTMKVMANLQGTSFMEDYTYHLEPNQELVLGAHMLEVCPSIAVTRPKLLAHPLGIGGKSDPARLVFDGRAGSALVASLVDLGNRFRLIVNEVMAVDAPQPMPNLPVARVLWKPEPSFEVSAESWIYAGGAHHTVFSYNVSSEQLSDWAHEVGVEFVLIDRATSVRHLRMELSLNDLVAKLR